MTKRVSTAALMLILVFGCHCKGASKDGGDNGKTSDSFERECKALASSTHRLFIEHFAKLKPATNTDQNAARLSKQILHLCTELGTEKQDRACLRNATRATQITGCLPNELEFFDALGPDLQCGSATLRGPVDYRGVGVRYYCDKAGATHGPEQVFIESRLFSSQTRTNGALDGAYYERGELSDLVGTYRAGKKHGTWRRVPAGSRTASALANIPHLGTIVSLPSSSASVEFKNGLADGPLEYLYATTSAGPSQPRTRGNYAAGKPHGVWKSFWRSRSKAKGELAYSGQFNKGVRDGQWSYYWQGNVKAAQGTYRGGKRASDWKFWNQKAESITETAALKLEHHWLRRELQGTPSLARFHTDAEKAGREDGIDSL